ncbi:hypothetical protein [Streptococcus macacae]|uniref:Uncharacterized protein n=1 Tax=Streptococcus macacae NCTC 11558 TaxID=764298 RepID=G5JYR9_9STRE|nr:hypothetical protein [Streptococcus macacae]EHJ53337.1 hypothetical protein STRMA_0333 [Streptococcus macacae NCTC 11558]SUN78178.1 Uncharacterised protein [Streptococcus macacae NCTC 11558]
MTANKKQHQVLWIVLGSLLGVIILIAGVIGGKYYMDKQRARELYQHGFRLYEEQIATYLKEHYSGIKKIEFSPIFIRRGGMSNANIVPVIYDEYGHREILGDSGKLDGMRSYGLSNGIELDFDGATGKKIIVLDDNDKKDLEVQDYDHLPDKAKWDSEIYIDENILKLVKQGHLKGIKKDSKGSPNARTVYNLEIKEGEYWKWH